MIFLSNTATAVDEAIESLAEMDKSDFEQFFSERFIPGLIEIGKVLLVAVLIYIVGRKIIKWLLKIINLALSKSSLEEGAVGFITTVCKAAFNFILIVIIAGRIGLETSSLVAVVSSVGLTVGLALQGSLSNFAGGVLILLLKPFRVGDYIIVGGNEGTVTKIDIAYTKILTISNKTIVLPNGTLSNSDITNTTNEPERRLDLVIPVHYETKIDFVKRVLTETAKSCEMVLDSHDIEIYVYEFSASSMDMAVRVWCNTEDYWPLKWELQEKIKIALDNAGIQIPYNQLDVKLVKSE